MGKKFNKNKQWLYRKYITNKKSLKNIGDELNLSIQTIANWLEFYGIKRRVFNGSHMKGKFGELHPSWKGGKYWINPQGYLVRKLKGKPIFLHVEIYCKYHDLIKVPKGYIIHHKDGNKLNNSIENLEMITQSKHVSHHNKLRKYKPHTEATKKKISIGVKNANKI